MNTLTVPAAHVSDHPAGQIVLPIRKGGSRASALSGYGMDASRNTTLTTIVRIAGPVSDSTWN
jgi:hypothetical protein